MAWQQAGGDKKTAKAFGNVIHMPMFDEDKKTAVIELLPPPELHLMLGAVNSMFSCRFNQYLFCLFVIVVQNKQAPQL